VRDRRLGLNSVLEVDGHVAKAARPLALAKHALIHMLQPLRVSRRARNAQDVAHLLAVDKRHKATFLLLLTQALRKARITHFRRSERTATSTGIEHVGFTFGWPGGRPENRVDDRRDLLLLLRKYLGGQNDSAGKGVPSSTEHGQLLLFELKERDRGQFRLPVTHISCVPTSTVPRDLYANNPQHAL